MGDSTDYENCVRLVASDPSNALETAGTWIVRGGGFAARDCQALALIQLGSAGEAAQRLEVLAGEMGRSGAPDLPTVLAQSGQAWLAAGQPEHAYAVQSAALKLTPDDVDLLIDRAVTLASRKNYREAVTDLDRALKLDPKRVDALVYRGTSYRFLDDAKRARADIDRALALDPGSIDALLERGNLKRLAGDGAGARADWLALLRGAREDSPQAAAARANIEKLDLRPR
jgi:tetratricopeptide (TPR) repeat protein